ncbi:MAG: spermidine synthase [Thermoprotei archaeon]|nr:MAG: spermidine synthase [Thermoprotei archaeon]
MVMIPHWEWIIEWFSRKEGHLHGIEEVYYIGKTKYQHVAIVKTGSFGKALFLDGFVQSTEYDEKIYHEALVHPVMLTHDHPEKVLIIGGGEGATLREVLRHKTVKHVVMVDIDRELIELCKKYMPEWSQGAFDDPRVTLVITDGRKYVENTDEKFDVVILDLTDPEKGTPAIYLYTREFYKKVYDILESDGLMVTQATSLRYYIYGFATIYNTIKTVFPKAVFYRVNVPSFSSDWGFVVGSKMVDPPVILQENRRERLKELGELYFVDEDALKHMFWIPRYIRKNIEKYKGISTDENPLQLGLLDKTPLF